MTGPFDDIAWRYDAWYATPIGAWADSREREAVFRMLALRPGERLLDIGSGTGRYALAAAQRGAAVTGVEPSAAMLAAAAARVAGSRVEFVRADAAHLPFPDQTFDAALSVTSLCFVDEPLKALREIRRVLRPEGRLVLGELNRFSLWALARRVERTFRETTYRRARFHTIGELRDLLEASAFTVVRWEGLLHLPPVNHATFLRAGAPIECVAGRWLPGLGAFLAIEARPVGAADASPKEVPVGRG